MPELKNRQFLEFEKPMRPARAKEILSKAAGVQLVDDPAGSRYPMPVDCAGKDDCLVGRIRADDSVENGLALWVAGDADFLDAIAFEEAGLQHFHGGGGVPGAATGSVVVALHAIGEA